MKKYAHDYICNDSMRVAYDRMTLDEEKVFLDKFEREISIEFGGYAVEDELDPDHSEPDPLQAALVGYALGLIAGRDLAKSTKLRFDMIGAYKDGLTEHPQAIIQNYFGTRVLALEPAPIGDCWIVTVDLVGWDQPIPKYFTVVK